MVLDCCFLRGVLRFGCFPLWVLGCGLWFVVLSDLGLGGRLVLVLGMWLLVVVFGFVMLLLIVGWLC